MYRIQSKAIDFFFLQKTVVRIKFLSRSFEINKISIFTSRELLFSAVFVLFCFFCTTRKKRRKRRVSGKKTISAERVWPTITYGKRNNEFVDHAEVGTRNGSFAGGGGQKKTGCRWDVPRGKTRTECAHVACTDVAKDRNARNPPINAIRSVTHAAQCRRRFVRLIIFFFLLFYLIVYLMFWLDLSISDFSWNV